MGSGENSVSGIFPTLQVIIWERGTDAAPVGQNKPVMKKDNGIDPSLFCRMYSEEGVVEREDRGGEERT